MKKKLQQYFNKYKKEKVLTIEDFKMFLMFKNKNDVVSITIDRYVFKFKDTYADVGIADSEGSVEWYHMFLTLDNNFKCVTNDNTSMVNRWLKELNVKVVLEKLYKENLNNPTPSVIYIDIPTPAKWGDDEEDLNTIGQKPGDGLTVSFKERYGNRFDVVHNTTPIVNITVTT